MADVHDEAEIESGAYSWVVRVLYLGLLAANAYLVFDWWRDTPGGEAMIARCRAKVEAAKAKAENCEGCARRRKKLEAMINRVHFDAEQIVEGKDVDTVPEPPA